MHIKQEGDITSILYYYQRYIHLFSNDLYFRLVVSIYKNNWLLSFPLVFISLIYIFTLDYYSLLWPSLYFRSDRRCWKLQCGCGDQWWVPAQWAPILACHEGHWCHEYKFDFQRWLINGFHLLGNLCMGSLKT